MRHLNQSKRWKIHNRPRHLISVSIPKSFISSGNVEYHSNGQDKSVCSPHALKCVNIASEITPSYFKHKMASSLDKNTAIKRAPGCVKMMDRLILRVFNTRDVRRTQEQVEDRALYYDLLNKCIKPHLQTRRRDATVTHGKNDASFSSSRPVLSSRIVFRHF